MKIGILTFHWATNYGAVLQCYALQSFLESKGHTVVVIDYKPKTYDDTLIHYLKYRCFLHHKDYLREKKKEQSLKQFRESHLHLSNRVYECAKIGDLVQGLDMVISGSDQVLNPYFLLAGEGWRCPSSAYFLDFPFKGKKIAYAVSFGCTQYPENAIKKASKLISVFDKVSVREVTGVNIVKAMGRNDAVIVPDPTLLQMSKFYHQIALESNLKLPNSYLYSFFIRNIDYRKKSITSLNIEDIILWNEDDNHYGLESWLSKIMHSKLVLTDSFHCMVICLKLHKPFVIVTDLEGKQGMNDRFYTILEELKMTNRIVHKSKIDQVTSFFKDYINWEDIDSVLSNKASIASAFFNYN